MHLRRRSTSPSGKVISLSEWRRRYGAPRTPRVPISDYPRITRFYGLSPQQLADTPQNILRIYAEALPKLEAEEQLARMTAALYPHMTEESMTRSRAAYAHLAGYETEEAEPLDPLTEHGKEVLAGLGIGVASS